MRYQQGSEAFDLRYQEAELQQQVQAPRFEVLEGRGLDAQARASLTARQVQLFVRALLVIAAVLVVAFVRVGLTTAAASTLSENVQLRNEVTQAVEDGRELRIECSLLSSSERISQIATSSFGMEFKGAGETIQMSTPAQP